MPPARTIVWLVAAAAVCHGVNLHLAGIAAASFATELGIAPQGLGLIFLLTAGGFIVGAAVGGWLGGSVGLQRTLMFSLLLYGVATLAMATSNHLASIAACRFIGGLGLGGAAPALVTFFNDAGSPQSAARRVAYVVAGVTTGRASLAALVAIAPALSWRTVSVAAGLAPVVVALLLLAERRRSESPRHEKAVSTTSQTLAVLAGGRGAMTTLVCLAHFLVNGANYILSSWLPSFLVQGGASHRQMGIVMLILAVSSAVGSTMAGWLANRVRRGALVLAFVLLATPGALVLVQAQGQAWAVVCGVALLGLSIGGGNAFVYDMVGKLYPPRSRAPAMGVAVSAGRFGSGVAPMIVGLMLGFGASQAAIFLVLAPTLLLAGIVVIGLGPRPQALEPA